MKNGTFKYGAFIWATWAMRGSITGRAHAYRRGKPIITGTNSSATNGRFRLAASNTRRETSPHCPPDMYCIIRSASDPIDRPRQNRNPISHDRRNWSTLRKAPMMPASNPQKAATRPQRCSRASAGTSVVSACVSMRSVFPRRVFTAARRWLRNLRRIASGDVGGGRVLAVLQRANVGHDRPPVARRDLSSVVRHHAEAVGDDVVEVPDVSLP